MKKLLFSGLMAAVIMAASPSLAEVTFDQDTGTGSIDHQDIKARFGSAALTPEGAQQVSYKTEQRRTFETQCRRGAAVRTFTRNITRTTLVNSTVELNPGGQVKGWSLDGYGTSTVEGTFCPAEWARNGTPVATANVFYRLRASFGDETRTLLVIGVD